MAGICRAAGEWDVLNFVTDVGTLVRDCWFVNQLFSHPETIKEKKNLIKYAFPRFSSKKE